MNPRMVLLVSAEMHLSFSLYGIVASLPILQDKVPWKKLLTSKELGCISVHVSEIYAIAMKKLANNQNS